MTLDEILTGYEDLWREAALSDRPQMRVLPGTGPRFVENAVAAATCAALIAPTLLEMTSHLYEYGWRCPDCGLLHCLLGSIMRHLNDAHGWTWLDFANKFRDVLAQGRTE